MGLCPVVGFGICGVAPFSSAARVTYLVRQIILK